jgi:tetratricopeptide (TPR) repeat protein
MQKFFLTLGALICWIQAPGQIQVKSSSELAKEVYQKLTRAIGDQQLAYPELEIRPGRSRVATFNCKQHKIYLDNEAINICASYGNAQDDALAIILGHELTHFYKKHQGTNCETHFLVAKEDFKAQFVEEHEADVYGGFIAQMAGYLAIEKIIDPLFEDLYKAYNGAQRGVNYPPLAQRKQLMKEACIKVNQLRLMYETAQHSIAIGHYELGTGVLQAIKKDLHFRELYNSLGVAQLKLGMSMGSWNDYYYPLAIDYQHPFRDVENPAEVIAFQYQQAVESLEQAIKMGPSYLPAYLNLCSAYELSKRPVEARELLKQLQLLPLNAEERSQAKIIEAIFLAHDGGKEAAKLLLLSLLKQADLSPANASIIQMNLDKLQGKSLSKSSLQTVFDDQLLAYDLFSPVPSSFRLAFTQTILNKPFQLYFANNTTLGVFSGESSNIKLHFTNSPTFQTSKQISVGDPASKLLAAYSGQSSQKQLAVRGYHLVFPGRGLFFQMDENDRVICWGVYG